MKRGAAGGCCSPATGDVRGVTGEGAWSRGSGRRRPGALPVRPRHRSEHPMASQGPELPSLRRSLSPAPHSHLPGAWEGLLLPATHSPEFSQALNSLAGVKLKCLPGGTHGKSGHINPCSVDWATSRNTDIRNSHMQPHAHKVHPCAHSHTSLQGTLRAHISFTCAHR